MASIVEQCEVAPPSCATDKLTLPLTYLDMVCNDHPRNAKDIYHFVPPLTEPKDVLGVQFAPVLAIQVTLFPNHGISICFVTHHIVGDESTIVGFIKSWASLNKYGGNDEFMMIPFYDRSIVKEPYGLKGLQWDDMKKHKSSADHVILTPPDNIVREDTDTDIIIDDNVMEYFSCTVDYRARFDPPLPSSYFGNCIVWYIVKTRHVDLVGNEGFIIAAESIGETIHKRNKDKEYVLSGEWLDEDDHLFKFLSVAGSPKFDLYATDFGWGRPEKWEFVSLQTGILMTLGKSKDSNGDLEIGLSLPKTQMNAFATIFTHGLEEIKI
ncbi:hypothetical protein KY285_004806 [Solanum tuberosum]|nr:hypothetical protein KY285_004806 [Solanum tuberosum]